MLDGWEHVTSEPTVIDSRSCLLITWPALHPWLSFSALLTKLQKYSVYYYLYLLNKKKYVKHHLCRTVAKPRTVDFRKSCFLRHQPSLLEKPALFHTHLIFKFADFCIQDTFGWNLADLPMCRFGKTGSAYLVFCQRYPPCPFRSAKVQIEISNQDPGHGTKLSRQRQSLRSFCLGRHHAEMFTSFTQSFY